MTTSERIAIYTTGSQDSETCSVSIPWNPKPVPHEMSPDIAERVRQLTPPNADLIERARTHQPPREWYDDETDLTAAE